MVKHELTGPLAAAMIRMRSGDTQHQVREQLKSQKKTCNCSPSKLSTREERRDEQHAYADHNDTRSRTAAPSKHVASDCQQPTGHRKHHGAQRPTRTRQRINHERTVANAAG